MPELCVANVLCARSLLNAKHVFRTYHTCTSKARPVTAHCRSRSPHRQVRRHGAFLARSLPGEDLVKHVMLRIVDMRWANLSIAGWTWCNFSSCQPKQCCRMFCSTSWTTRIYLFKVCQQWCDAARQHLSLKGAMWANKHLSVSTLGKHTG